MSDYERITINDVIYRKTTPIDFKAEGLESKYRGFKQETVTLPKGTIAEEGYMPLPCDIVFERDVPVKLRDGITIYTDIFRPVTDEAIPAIVAWGPYGKNGSGALSISGFPGMLGIDKSLLSGLAKFEGPDPGYWCARGYAVCNPDIRGAFMSEGNITFWGKQDGEDGYDYIEWLARQAWCNGKTALSGNLWLAISQWYIAAEQPPHLTVIAPWEGNSNHYVDDVVRGGIPYPGFVDSIIIGLFGNNYIEDSVAMIEKYPLMNDYWKSKIPQFERINVPAYVVSSHANNE